MFLPAAPDPGVPNSTLDMALITYWPIMTVVIIAGGVLGALTGIKFLGSGLTGPSESLAFLAATTGPIFAGMSGIVWTMFSTYNVPYNGIIVIIVGAFYGMGLFFGAGEMGGGSGTS
jgi:hypothetical protein